MLLARVFNVDIGVWSGRAGNLYDYNSVFQGGLGSLDLERRKLDTDLHCITGRLDTVFNTIPELNTKISKLPVASYVHMFAYNFLWLGGIGHAELVVIPSGKICRSLLH